MSDGREYLRRMVTNPMLMPQQRHKAVEALAELGDYESLYRRAMDPLEFPRIRDACTKALSRKHRDDADGDE